MSLHNYLFAALAIAREPWMAQKRKASSDKVDAGVEGLETFVGRHLPGDYRAYLQNVNGGKPPSTGFVIPKINVEATVGVLYGVGVQPGMDIIIWLKELEGDIPERWIPIGRDLGGNVLLMDLSTDSSAPVLLWDRNRELPKTTNKVNTYLVADTFSQFLEMLQ